MLGTARPLWGAYSACNELGASYLERLLAFSRWRSHISENAASYSAKSPSSDSTPRRSLRSLRSSTPESAGSRRTFMSFSGATSSDASAKPENASQRVRYYKKQVAVTPLLSLVGSQLLIV